MKIDIGQEQHPSIRAVLASPRLFKQYIREDRHLHFCAKLFPEYPVLQNNTINEAVKELNSEATIRRTATLFHQGTHGVNEDSDLNKLPVDILLKIAGDTRTADTHSEEQIRDTAIEGFSRLSP